MRSETIVGVGCSAPQRENKLADLHLWRLGTGHLGAIVSIMTTHAREADYYHERLTCFKSLSHLTVEVLHKS
jgi:hypothetical protein